MSTPTQLDTQLNSLDVELAKFGGVSLTDATQVTTYVAMITSALGTTSVGHWAGLPTNARIISAAAFGLICVAHIVMRYLHHGVVEKQNTDLKKAMIAQAATSGTPILVDSAPNVSGVVDAAPAVDAAVVDNTSPSVGADVPVVDTTTSTVTTA